MVKPCASCLPACHNGHQSSASSDTSWLLLLLLLHVCPAAQVNALNARNIPAAFLGSAQTSAQVSTPWAAGARMLGGRLRLSLACSCSACVWGCGTAGQIASCPTCK
jgi:hypothetical protein